MSFDCTEHLGLKIGRLLQRILGKRMPESTSLVSHRFKRINENLISELVEGYIFFAGPSSFNDPYDCRINIEHSLANAIAVASNDQKALLQRYDSDLISEIKKRSAEVGVACFTNNLENTLMWSHYAENHSGLCLTYEIPSSLLLDNVDKLLGWQEIKYGNESIKECFLSVKADSSKNDFDNFIQPLITSIFCSKSEPWAYEEEFRIISSQPGPTQIDKKWLKQVCFGLSTSDRNIRLICSLINAHGYHDVGFAKMIRTTEHDFGFRAESWKC